MNDKKRIVLIGGGGHCKSILDTLFRIKQFDEIVITDPALPSDSTILNVKVIGTDTKLSELYTDGFHEACIAIGSIKSTNLRKNLFHSAQQIGFAFPTIIDPSAQISDYAKIGSGVFVGKNAVINAGAQIDDMGIINTGAIIEHDCKIGRFTHISVGAILCGNVQIGHDSFVGAGTTIIQGTTIGNTVVIGAGSIVLKDIESTEIQKGIIK